MATLYKADGSTRQVEPDNGSSFELEQLYDLLNCDMIQVVPVGKGEIMVIDEEGKLKSDAKINKKATERARGFLFAGDVIVGNALVCKDEELK